MKNIEIQVGKEKYSFTTEILVRHLRKIEPITEEMQSGAMPKMDFFIKMAVVLCESENSETLEESLDNLNIAGMEKFTKDFEPVMESVEKFNTQTEENKKK